MRSVLLIIVIVSAGLSSACTKRESSPDNGRNLPGTWKLKETMMSPGFTVPWEPYKGPARYMTLYANGSVKAGSDVVWGTYDRYYVKDDQNIIFINSATSDSVNYRYEQSFNSFTLYFQCYEACGSRFKRVF